VIAGCFCLLTVVFVSVFATSPSDSTLQRGLAHGGEGISIDVLAPRPDGLHRDDVVVAVDGRGLAALPRLAAHLGDRHTYLVRRGPGPLLEIPVTLGPFPFGAALAAGWATLLLVATLGGLAVYVFARRPDEPGANTLLVVAGLFTCAATTMVMGSSVIQIGRGATWWAYLGGSLARALLWGSLLHLALVFPKAPDLLARWPRLMLLTYGLPLALHGVYLAAKLPTASMPLARVELLACTRVSVEYVVPVLVLAALLAGYRRVPDSSDQRSFAALTAWFAVSVGAWLVLWKLPLAVLDRPFIEPSLHLLVFMPCLLALAVAIVRRQVFDIGIVLRRSLLYAGLTVGVIVIYTLTVGLGTLIPSPHAHQMFSLAATGLVALAFSPLRQHLQRSVNRLLYGERDNPYTILSWLGGRLEQTRVPDEVLPEVVTTVARALRLPYAAIELGHADGPEVAAAYGVPSGELLHLDLSYQGEPIGRMVLGRRRPGESFGLADHRTLQLLAQQAGIAAHAVLLTREVRRSREQLVLAREEERRRLRRDLHDGVGSELGAAVLWLQEAGRLCPTDPDAAKNLTVRVTEQIRSVITDIRRLIYGLRPPSLDQLGLVGALRERAGSFVLPEQSAGMRVTVEVTGELKGLPAAVEAAAFRIGSEALTNASHHARATSCQIRLTRLESALEVEVADDGCGIPDDHRPGIGLSSMRERAAELGGSFTVERVSSGGTRVWAHLPVASARSTGSEPVGAASTGNAPEELAADAGGGREPMSRDIQDWSPVTAGLFRVKDGKP
jgi:signal transduction histidine kinase